MNRRQQILVLFALHLGLAVCIGEINYQLAPHALHLHLDVLLVLFAGLYLRAVHSVVFTAGLGLLCGALYPFAVGGYALVLAALWLVIALTRPHLRREQTLPVTLLAVLVQLLYMLAATVWFHWGHLGEWLVWQRFLIDAALNCALLATFTGRWIRLNISTLFQIGWDIEAEPKSA